MAIKFERKQETFWVLYVSSELTVLHTAASLQGIKCPTLINHLF